MARAIERIEQDLATLEEAIDLLATELQSTYSNYLKLLGQSVRRQLILASYQVCTHGYPKSFLRLSFNQRQTLQDSVKQLGGQAKERLLLLLEQSKNSSETEGTNPIELEPTAEQSPVIEATDPIELEPTAEQSPVIEATDPIELEPTAEQSPVNVEPQEPPQEELPETYEISGDSDVSLDASETAEISKTKTPPSKLEQLAQWREKLEEAIAKTLQTTSLETNRLLQQTEIIPGKFPAAVLEAAAKVEAPGEVMNNSPNLLNLLMETESEDSEDSTLTRIIAIHLRLSEIEFADPILSAGRNQLRNLSSKTQTLQRQYHKKQRELAVAQAEVAWRSSWFDD